MTVRRWLSKSSAFLPLLLSLGFAAGSVGSLQAFGADKPAGEIKVCRRPRLVTLTDKESVPIPADGRYSGPCDQKSGQCRVGVSISVTRGGIVGPGQSHCAILPAILESSDGKALRIGEQLRIMWDIPPGFEPVAIVSKPFR